MADLLKVSMATKKLWKKYIKGNPYEKDIVF